RCQHINPITAGKTTAVTGSYKGLFQQNEGGWLAPYSSAGILQQTPAQQIANFATAAGNRLAGSIRLYRSSASGPLAIIPICSEPRRGDCAECYDGQPQHSSYHKATSSRPGEHIAFLPRYVGIKWALLKRISVLKSGCGLTGLLPAFGG